MRKIIKLGITSLATGSFLLASLFSVTGKTAITGSFLRNPFNPSEVKAAKATIVVANVKNYEHVPYYRWKTSTITYHIATGSSYYKGMWKKAVANWNRENIVDLIPASASKADIKLGTNNTSKDSGDVGLTTYDISSNSGTVNGVTLFPAAYAVNSKIYPKILKKDRYNYNQREKVAEHELGHALGLSHDKRKYSIMNPYRKNVYITSYDKAVLAAIYK